MTKYQTKPVIVEAFQMNADNKNNIDKWPDWAIASKNKDSRQVGSIHLTDPEKPDGAYSLRTEYGEIDIPMGSWVVKTDPDAEKYMVMRDDHFEAAYISSNDADKPSEAKTVMQSTKEIKDTKVSIAS